MNKHSFISLGKYNIAEQLFCILTGLYLIYAILPYTTYYFSFPAHTTVYVFICLGAVVFIKTGLYCLLTLKEEHRLPAQLLAAIPLVLLYGAVFLSNRYLPVMFLILLTVGCIGTDYKKILKTYVVFVGLFLLCTILCTLCGGLVNFVFIKDGHIRSSWGINYPTDLAAYLVYINTFAWIIWKNVKKYFFILSGALVTFLSFYIARSSTSTICGILFIVLVCYDIIMEHFQGRYRWLDFTDKCIRILESLAFPLLGAFVFILMAAFHRGIGAAYKANDFLSSRLAYACQAYDKYGLSLLGRQFKMIGFGGSTFANSNYDFIDISYALILLRYGCIFFIVTALLWTLTSYKAVKRGDLRLTAGMALIAFHSFSEHHFVDLYFNILLAMPLADYAVPSLETVPLSGLESVPLFDRIFPFVHSQESEADKRQGKENSRISHLISAAVTLFCILFFTVSVYPTFLSRMRTICDIFEVTGSPYKKAVLFLIMLVLIALLFALFYSVYHLILSLSKGKRPRIAVIICPLVCFLILFSGLAAGSTIINRSMAGYKEELEADRDAIKSILKNKGTKLYVDDIPELYKHEFGSITTSVFSGDELARYKNVTILMPANYESACFINKGFLYGQISPKHAIYTNDPQVIDSLKAEGQHLTGYYSKKKKVNLERLAELNHVRLTDEGYLPLSGKKSALKKGPDINLRSGDYTTSYKLEIPEDSFNKNKDSDYLVCTLQINTLFGDNNVITMPVYRNQFNKKGEYIARITYSIPESLGVQFLASAEKEQEVYIGKITYQKTPEYDTHRFYDSRGRVIREEYYDLEGNTYYRSEGYAACEYSYDSQDNINIFRYYDKKGNLTLNTSGYAELRRSFNLQHQVVRDEYYGCDGNPVLVSGGYASVAYVYDDDGNQKEMDFYDKDNKPTLAWNSFSKIIRSYNPDGQMTREESYGTDGNLSMRPEGFAVEEREYDKDGHLIRQFYYDTDEKPALHASGYAAVYHFYDEFGRLIRDEYYDTHNKRTALHGNRSAAEYEYDDKGNQIVLRYYGVDDQPVMAWNSFFTARRVFNEKNLFIEESYYDTDDKQILCSLGYAYEEREYDAASNIITQKYLGLDKKPILRTDGYAEVHKDYDIHRHIIKEEYYGLDGELINLPQGYSTIIREYDEKGNLLHQYYYDDKGNLIYQE